MTRQYISRLDRNILTGILITLSGSFFYVLMGSLSKLAGKQLSLNQILFLQSITGLSCAVYLIKIRRYSFRQLWRRDQRYYLLRIIFSLGSIYALIAGLRQMSVFNALVILNSSPLIIPFLRKMLFGKKINLSIFPAVICAFSGITLILSPDPHIFDASFVIVLISMLCMTFSLLVLERQQDARPDLSIFYYFFYSSLITGALLIFRGESLPYPGFFLVTGLLIGVLFFLVQLSIIHAASYISSQLISVLFYSEIILALISSLLFEHLEFTANHAWGIILVIVGGSMTTLIEQKFSDATKANKQKLDDDMISIRQT
ncbi:hypothetical protein AQUSIP_13620 [Aquicella siphonis]|uniref:EamA domain-containing protein n=1 Tax=Aquicella siphonis TaxID=254247 RepID=A0A5E4PGA9_9COXI|nr:DMT family transporter [Aquicella siphonis]VVC76060.1 hypothetical protein AQUSIP_13620 [Aquicella siphonis]